MYVEDRTQRTLVPTPRLFSINGLEAGRAGGGWGRHLQSERAVPSAVTLLGARAFKALAWKPVTGERTQRCFHLLREVSKHIPLYRFLPCPKCCEKQEKLGGWVPRNQIMHKRQGLETGNSKAPAVLRDRMTGTPPTPALPNTELPFQNVKNLNTDTR